MRISYFLAALLAAASSLNAADLPERTLLWPDKAPHAEGEDESDQPAIRVYLPEKDIATGAGVVICPGGGYGILATDHEGHQVAKWLNRIGVAGFVLRYRHAPKYRHPVPMEDAQRAVRHVRANAEKYGVATNRVGILGFSAGGHLASTVATHFDKGNATAENAIDRQSCRPDFAVLCYPVINLAGEYGHTGSGRNLLGPNPDEKLLKSLCNETQVTSETPPTFLFHTAEDGGVPVRNSIEFFLACQRHKVPSELHVYQDGPHGVGLSPADPAVFGWKDRLADWMRASGFLAEVTRAEVSGKITLDGKPLRWGMVAFVPDDGNKPRAWAMVSRGDYSIPQKRGAPTGTTCRVEIYDLGSVEPQPTKDDFELLRKSSSLVVQFGEGKNEMNLDLTSD
ncbi:MAG: alpha/beta hydrolase [Planctomycetota bacterium]|nr:alpha/beta hydrolase [Planctomycetota bacterium]